MCPQTVSIPPRCTITKRNPARPFPTSFQAAPMQTPSNGTTSTSLPSWHLTRRTTQRGKPSRNQSRNADSATLTCSCCTRRTEAKAHVWRAGELSRMQSTRGRFEWAACRITASSMSVPRLVCLPPKPCMMHPTPKQTTLFHPQQLGVVRTGKHDAIIRSCVNRWTGAVGSQSGLPCLSRYTRGRPSSPTFRRVDVPQGGQAMGCICVRHHLHLCRGCGNTRSPYFY